jgi:hypothetical protein
MMRSLVIAGAGQFEELASYLKTLEMPFESCVKDLRSQVTVQQYIFPTIHKECYLVKAEMTPAIVIFVWNICAETSAQDWHYLS